MTAPASGREDFVQAFDVSRETLARFDVYASLLERWSPRINLVSASTLPDVWTRHFADSAQLLPLAPPAARTWLDLGSGAGFPGMALALLAREARPDLHFRLVESDQRKCVFLRRVSEETGTPVAILLERIESLPPQHADIVSARALSPLAQLLAHAEKHLTPGGIGLFPKGRTVHKEIAEAGQSWRFPHRVHPSMTDAEAAIVETGAPVRA